MKVAALLLADAEEPDVLVRVHGVPLLGHALRGLLDTRCVNRVVVAVPPHRLDACAAVVRAVPGAEDQCQVLPGGADRAVSVRLALTALDGESYDVYLVHDAARAFAPPTTIRAVAEAVFEGAEAVAPVLPVTDTIKLVDAADVIVATKDRGQLRAIQSPYGCTESVLRALCARGADPLDVPGTVRTVAGHPHAIRLATPFDLAVAEALLLQETP
ncbi:MAG TPA: 2-C-methyl-D-erythritol 4-phosphate cytidylyltransferase [Amycolatopsis sp.]|nr:2-C-methyl-D-erythritol 4-phosphate cytidylyltransferase [Amycolatopsis sp.]